MEGLKGYDEASDIRDDLEPKEIRTILQHLRTFGIFYAAPLDLDYAMLQKFQAAYKHPEPGDCGPHSSDPTNTVMGEAGTRLAYWSNEERLELLRWYRYLFMSRSKPSTHLQALGHLSDGELSANRRYGCRPLRSCRCR
ncbi:hypothetical protein OHA79_47060 (plasmid) [Streptomyces sp. NBC_00841]|uniref:hypothetical protein n=1 Tax=Streptomyces sp. NBC_00841 TaxID=2975847 RepID=UPI002DD8C2EE|nr:hypothetical protein [Streptomyces sp. NBC_00841]WSA05160.1 hypothetical protein OHA79_47060 [Streptomyces sp. NBC_00841]